MKISIEPCLIAGLTLLLQIAGPAAESDGSGYFYTVGGINGKAADGHALEGQFGTIYRSKDGETWENVFKGGPVTEDFSHARNNMLRCLTFGGEKLVASGNSGLFYSTDGKDWKLAESPRGSFSVAYGNGLFLAPSAPDILVSKDGITWERHQPELDVPVWGKEGAGHIRKIVFGNGVFVCLGEQRLGITKDGRSWLHHKLLSEEEKTGQRSTIVFGAGRFVWFTEKGGIRTGTDGWNWEPVSLPETNADSPPGANGCWTGEAFVVAGKDCLYRSKDGLTWEKQDAAGGPLPLAAGNGLLLGNQGWSKSFRVSADDGATWKEIKPEVGSRKVYFFDGKEVRGPSGG